MEPRILLLQARKPDDPMKAQEVSCFSRRTGLALEKIVSHDLLDGPPTLDRARQFDALMVGGSGEFLVSERDLPEFDRLLDFLRRLVDHGMPTFASCFGFQCMVEALGGEIIHDPEAIEVGTYDLWLTEEGAADPLLGRLPERFLAQMGRKDRARLLPAGVLHLAASERCPFQAFRIPGRPIRATQFHPELTVEDNRERFAAYLDKYEHVMSAAERERALERFRESPATSDLLRVFVEEVLERRGAPGRPSRQAAAAEQPGSTPA